MRAKIRDKDIYFDIEGAGLVIDGDRMKERPTAFLVHGGPGGDHTSYKAGLSDLSQKMQLVYFDHRGQGRSARGLKEASGTHCFLQQFLQFSALICLCSQTNVRNHKS